MHRRATPRNKVPKKKKKILAPNIVKFTIFGTYSEIIKHPKNRTMTCNQREKRILSIIGIVCNCFLKGKSVGSGMGNRRIVIKNIVDAKNIEPQLSGLGRNLEIS